MNDLDFALRLPRATVCTSKAADAKADFGGHKQRAIKDINFAINDIQLAIEHAKD